MNKGFESVLEILPFKISEALAKETDILEEIRIKTGSPVYVYSKNREKILYFNNEIILATNEDVEYILKKATKNSVYAYSEDIKNGFVTIENGHRIGISGKAVYENKKLVNIKDINALNIRCAREIKGSAEDVVEKIYSDNKLKNTLIVSPPKCGKTTILRDIARILSGKKGIKIALVDERDEIASGYLNKSAIDIGSRTFVLSGYMKKEGFAHAIRGLSPNVIICDEIGDKEDYDIINDALLRGVKVIASLHGEYDKKLPYNFSSLFERFVFLTENYEKRVCKLKNGEYIEY